MFKYTNLITYSLLLTSTASIAQSSKIKSTSQLQKTTLNSSQASVTKIKNVKPTQQSRLNREDQKYTLNIGATGINFGTGTNNYEAGYFYKPNRVIGIQYQEFRNSLPLFGSNPSQDESDFERNKKGHAILLSYKSFMQNSFYIKSSLYHRIQERIVKNSNKFQKINYEDTGLLFALGNQWQWKNFTMGVDWVGMSTVLAIINQEGDYKLEKQELADWSLLNLYLGYSF